MRSEQEYLADIFNEARLLGSIMERFTYPQLLTDPILR